MPETTQPTTDKPAEKPVAESKHLVFVNKKKRVVPKGKTRLSFEDVADMAGMSGELEISWVSEKAEGLLYPGNDIPAPAGMKFTVSRVTKPPKKVE